MGFKRPISASFPQTSSTTSEGLRRSATSSSHWNDLCRVCGDQARINNYGALSCQSCKTFFRRNGFRIKNVRPCVTNECCEVNKQTRQNCTACRLAKCLSIGMSPDLIRKAEKKPIKRRSTSILSERAIMRPEPISPSNDRACLSSTDWVLLSNIVHAHDQFNVVVKYRQTTDLSFDATNIIQLIKMLFNSVFCIIRSSSDFQALTLNEQSSLAERNFCGIVSVYSLLVFRDMNMMNNPQRLENLIDIYGLNMTMRSKYFLNQMDPDVIFLRIMIFVLSLSSNLLVGYEYENISNESLLKKTNRLFYSQNIYVEMFWKYLIYRHGFHQSILRLVRMIHIILALIDDSAWNYTNNVIHHDLVNESFETLRRSFFTDQKKSASTWGQYDL